jgi:hypothetical protein
VAEVAEVTELRRWQAGELADAFVAALAPHRKGKAVGKMSAESPYRE